METDHIALLLVGIFGIGLGLYTLREAKKYSARKNSELAEKQQPRT